MTYAVVWAVAALQEVARIERAAADPAAVRTAAAFVDYALRRFPRDVGESRAGDFRVWYGDVIGVRYRVDDAAGRVEVLAAAPARRH